MHKTDFSHIENTSLQFDKNPYKNKNIYTSVAYVRCV